MIYVDIYYSTLHFFKIHNCYKLFWGRDIDVRKCKKIGVKTHGSFTSSYDALTFNLFRILTRGMTQHFPIISPDNRKTSR